MTDPTKTLQLAMVQGAISGTVSGGIYAMINDTKLSRGILQGMASGAATGAVMWGIGKSVTSRVSNKNQSGRNKVGLNGELGDDDKSGSILKRRRKIGTEPYLVARGDPETGFQLRVTMAVDDPKTYNFVLISKLTDSAGSQILSGTISGVLELDTVLSVNLGYQEVQDFLVYEQWEYTELVEYDDKNTGAIVGEPMPDYETGGARRVKVIYSPIGETYKTFAGKSCVAGSCSAYEYEYEK